jgi:hypothetical protein
MDGPGPALEQQDFEVEVARLAGLAIRMGLGRHCSAAMTLDTTTANFGGRLAAVFNVQLAFVDLLEIELDWRATAD